MFRSSPFRSTWNTRNITALALGMCEVCTETIRSTWNSNMNIITALGMCEVCSEAVHSVALWTQTFWFQHENGFAQQALFNSQKHANARIEHKARKREMTKTRKPEKTRKRRKRENAKTAKTRKRAKQESGSCRKQKYTTANRTSKQRRTEMGKARQDENAKTAKSALVIWFSRFLVFSFRWPHLAGQVAFFTILAKMDGL